MTAMVDIPVAQPKLSHLSASSIRTGDGEVPAPQVPVSIEGLRESLATNGATNGVSYDDPFELDTKFAYTPRKIKVITIGAGFSGLLMAHKFQHRFPELRNIVEHSIFEARSDIGGTWLANDYPGVQCDVPAHIYAFPFDPNPDWSRFYASGGDILNYMKATVQKWSLDKDLHLNTRVVGAHWQPESKQWKVTVEHEAHQRDEYCHVLISAQGVLVHEAWPKGITGLDIFQGHVTHSARWDHSYDYSNKRIAVIGNGSSGIQIVPQMAKLSGTEVKNFIRGPAWVYYRAPPSKHLGRDDPDPNPAYTDEERQRFHDPEYHLEHRKGIISRTNKSFYIFMKGKNNEEGVRLAAAQMAAKLNHDKRLCDMLIPKWELGCRRITPGPGYLESFLRPNCDLTNSPITRIAETGVHTADGEFFECDVVVCATGFDVSHRPRFPVVGVNGVDLSETWKSDPESYISVAVPNIPNYFLMMGPNCLGGHGSLVESLNWTGDYFCKWIKKMATEDISHVMPKQEKVDAFVKYTDQVHKNLVWTGGCSSWYKRGRVNGRVTALFGGSSHLFNRMLSEIRAEDFDVTYNTENPFRFMGNGFTEWEFKEDSDLSWYVELADRAPSVEESAANGVTNGVNCNGTLTNGVKTNGVLVDGSN